MQADQVPCFILHRRVYGETSLIIDVLAQDHGRLHLVLKGAQNTTKVGKQSLLSGLAQVFRPLLLSFSGKGELKSARTIEDNGAVIALQDKYLYSGFYLNELICRLWPQNIESDELYPCYFKTLNALAQCQRQQDQSSMALESQLRQFELTLLRLLGFEIDCQFTGDNGTSTSTSNMAIERQQQYIFVAQQGFVLAPEPRELRQPCYLGEHILAIGELDFSTAPVLTAAKQLVRAALAPHLGQKPLKSRELFKRII